MRVILVSLLVLGFISCNKSEDETVVSSNDSIAMGPAYANDIYYSFSKGIISTAPRNNWDIAFKTSPRSSSILINSTMGVKLWQYNGDTTKWTAALDTAGIKKTWVSLLDSDTTWSLSSFEANQTGHPNYGWGEYNSINHDVIGTAFFIIQLQDKSFKKIWIKKRIASTNTYVFTYADLNGSNAVTKNLVTGNYLSKNYVYFKLSTGEVVDREPAQNDWDVVLTKYYEMVFNNSTQKYEPYNVTGILQNEGVTVAEVSGDVASNNYSGQKFATSISTIGSDWKTLDMQTFAFTIKPEVKYFVQTKSKNIYKVVFKKFEGSSTGKVVFEKTKLK
jgi:hypothetical protein